MKKIIFVLISVTILCTALAGCGKSKEPAFSSSSYSNKPEEVANTNIDEQAAEELKEKKAVADIAAARAKNEDEGTNNLVGFWEREGKTIEFTGDGAYIIFENNKKIIWRFEIVDSQNLKITKDTGESYNQPIKLLKTNSSYELSMPPETLTKK